MLRRLFIVLIYCLLSLTVISLSLIYLFPRETLLSWTEQVIERKFPGIECRIGAVRYIHPLKIRLYEIVLRSRRYRVELPVETLLLSFEPGYPVKNIGVVGVLLGGAINAELGLAADGAVTFDNLEFSEVHLGDLEELEGIINRPLHGLLSFNGRAAIDRSNARAFSLIGSLEITGFHTQLRQSILGESAVYFTRLSADISQGGTRMELLTGRAAGPLLSATFYGEIQGDRPWDQSLLQISGNLTVQPGLLEKHPELAEQLKALYQHDRKQSLAYDLGGTIAEPQFRFAD